MQTITIYIRRRPELSAGIRGYTETMQIKFLEGGWDEKDFVDYMRDFFDGAEVTTVKPAID